MDMRPCAAHPVLPVAVPGGLRGPCRVPCHPPSMLLPDSGPTAYRPLQVSPRAAGSGPVQRPAANTGPIIVGWAAIRRSKIHLSADARAAPDGCTALPRAANCAVRCVFVPDGLSDTAEPPPSLLPTALSSWIGLFSSFCIGRCILSAPPLD